MRQELKEVNRLLDQLKEEAERWAKSLPPVPEKPPKKNGFTEEYIRKSGGFINKYSSKPPNTKGNATIAELSYIFPKETNETIWVSDSPVGTSYVAFALPNLKGWKVMLHGMNTREQVDVTEFYVFCIDTDRYIKIRDLDIINVEGKLKAGKGVLISRDPKDGNILIERDTYNDK